MTCLNLVRFELLEKDYAWNASHVGNSSTAGKQILHFGPHERMRRDIKACPRVHQVSIDFFAEGYKYHSSVQQADIRSLNFPDESMDVVICLHVLEHVRQLSVAMFELVRVLKPRGTALVEVPCHADRGHHIDCSHLNSTSERIICGGEFGQRDHVWNLGCLALASQLQNFGLNCTDVSIPSNKEVARLYRVAKAQRSPLLPFFICVKAEFDVHNKR